MSTMPTQPSRARRTFEPLYTPEQRLRRDNSYWTVIQGLLAPIQFLVFLVSVVLVINFLNNGTGYAAATASVVCKTALLLLIMVTGAIWEKVVFGQYLFAEAFYWEDMVSMVVIALHCAYVAAWLFDLAGPQQQMWLALAAYAAYVVNAAQFLIKFSAARRDGQEASASPGRNGNWAGATE
jgi:3-vinyl bacteriochlorophyllide hydratase